MTVTPQNPCNCQMVLTPVPAHEPATRRVHPDLAGSLALADALQCQAARATAARRTEAVAEESRIALRIAQADA